MIEHIHIHPMAFMRLKRREYFSVRHVQGVISLIGEIPTLQKVKAVLCTHEAKCCFDSDVGVEDGLTEREISSLEELNKELDLLEETLERNYEVVQQNYLKDKRKAAEMRSLVLAMVDENLPLRLIEILGRVCFESRKRIVQIISVLLQDGNSEIVDVMHFYFERNANTLTRLLTYSFEYNGIALHCGDILRKCFKHTYFVRECLTEDMLFFKKFFGKYLQSECFDYVSDGFATIRALLTCEPELVAEFLTEFGEKFSKQFNEELLESSRYLTQRKSLELLHDILFERRNFSFMVNYVNKKCNLILIMRKMVDSSHAIRFNSLHIFKIFVANPHKSDEVNRILCLNKEKLIKFLESFDSSDLSDNERNEILTCLNNCETIHEPEPAINMYNGFRPVGIPAE